MFHTVWSYWLNTRVRIVRLKRKKMRVFFSFHLFFSFPFLLLLLFERSAGGRHRYTHAHCGCLSTPAVVAAPFSIQWNKPTKKTKTKGMRVTNDQTQWTEWIGEDSANYFRRYQSVKLIRDWLRFSSSVREQHLLHKNSFFCFFLSKNRIEQKKILGSFALQEVHQPQNFVPFCVFFLFTPNLPMWNAAAAASGSRVRFM